MGLVLDPVTGKKMKSREGNAFSAEDAMELVIKRLNETPEPRKLAWNIVSWNFLQSGRTKDVKFSAEEWTKPESMGLYITYTYARILSAMQSDVKSWDPRPEGLTEEDVAMLGFSQYVHFYYGRAAETLDPSPLARYAGELAMKLGAFYFKNKIAGARPGLQYAVLTAHALLKHVMEFLGMFPLDRV